MTTDDIRVSALRLLRLLNERQAKDQTNATVIPDNTTVADAGLGHRSSEECETALGWLLEEEALEPDHLVNEQVLGGRRPVVGVSDSEHGFAFKITPHGMSLLQQLGG